MNNKKITLLLLTFLFPLLIFSQVLEENKIDEFTNSNIKRTSWELINMNFAFTAYFRVSSINNINYFEIKLMIVESAYGKVFSINKDQEIMFKLKNGEIVKLPNFEYAITCIGCGARGISGSNAQGIKVSYILNDEYFQMLKLNMVEKIRIYTNDGYVENEIKEKNAVRIKNALTIIE